MNKIPDELLLHVIPDKIFIIPNKIKKISNLTPQASHKFVVISKTPTSSEKELLSKILSAVSINLNSIKFLEEYDTAILFERALIFGNFEVPGCGMEFYKVETTDTKYLRSRSLAVLKNSKKDKEDLWKGLKKWFGI